ncbi:MAG: DUF3795 domain-containing protein [Candidatus Fermentibacter sp.]|nr:DUF3795 domain-containing protein [Candidatus Fermentibacter sp.]
MEYRFDAPCGLYCGACPTIPAGRKGSLADLAKSWEMEPEDLVCHGCLSDTTAVFCRDCDFRSCTKAKGIVRCSECDTFPCEELVKFRNDEAPHHSVVLANLSRISEIDLESWLDEQRVRWSCPSCGEPFAWYDAKCAGCGADLFDCREEEKTLS